MITGYYCTNIFSEQAQELIEFYRDILEIPFIRTDVDSTNGVYLGFIEKSNSLCIWDCKAFNAPPIDDINHLFFKQKISIPMMVCLKKRSYAI